MGTSDRPIHFLVHAPKGYPPHMEKKVQYKEAYTPISICLPKSTFNDDRHIVFPLKTNTLQREFRNLIFKMQIVMNMEFLLTKLFFHWQISGRADCPSPHNFCDFMQGFFLNILQNRMLAFPISFRDSSWICACFYINIFKRSSHKRHRTTRPLL